MDHVRWLADPDGIMLTNPVVVAAFTGWNDAGDAASTALRTMIETSGAAAAGRDRPRVLHRLRHRATARATRRRSQPFDRVADGRGVGASLPGTDVILVLGPEPALRWREFCEQIVGIAQRLGATMGFTIGALLADVPHTRPTQIIGTATDDALIDRFELERSRYEGPTGIVGVLHDALSRNGLADGVAVGGGARLRLAAAVAAGGDGTRRTGLLDDGHAGTGGAPGRRRSPTTTPRWRR